MSEIKDKCGKELTREKMEIITADKIGKRIGCPVNHKVLSIIGSEIGSRGALFWK